MELKNSGYNLLVCNSDTNVEMELQCLKMLEKRQIDGVILIGMNMPVSHIEKYGQSFRLFLWSGIRKDQSGFGTDRQ